MKCKIGKFSIPIEQQSNEYSEEAKIKQKRAIGFIIRKHIIKKED